MSTGNFIENGLYQIKIFVEMLAVLYRQRVNLVSLEQRHYSIVTLKPVNYSTTCEYCLDKTCLNSEKESVTTFQRKIGQ